jgi:hypothetical protein
MSDSSPSHVSFGRTPWRRQLQLRLFPAQADDEPAPVFTLSYKARQIEADCAWKEFQRDEAQRRLRILCEWLDDHLDNAVRVSAAGSGVRQVKVLDGLAFKVDSNRREISCAHLLSGEVVPGDWIFEVGHPLSSPRWLAPVIANLGLVSQVQGDIIFDANESVELRDWLAGTAYRLLCRDPDFQALRRRLPGLFEIPREIVSIALACRPRPIGPLIDSRSVNDVWRNEKAFRLVARENPQLLPLLFAFVSRIREGEAVQTKDPIQTVKERFRQGEVSEAGWRYLTKHGARIFRIPWELSGNQCPLEVAIRYLNALDDAGLPPPPPPSIQRVLLHGYNQHVNETITVEEHFQAMIDPVALRAGLLEADRRRRQGTVAGFIDEFLGVCWWSAHIPEPLDDNQAKAGWPWFLRRWQEAERVQQKLDESESLSWTTRLDEFSDESVRVVPLRSSEDLVREGQAMRNCLENYASRCEDGEFEVYSVRDAVTGKRLGCIGVRYAEFGLPIIVDTKGIANTPPKGVVRRAADEMLRKLHFAARNRQSQLGSDWHRHEEQSAASTGSPGEPASCDDHQDASGAR